MPRSAWTPHETAAALELDEATFLARHPHRTAHSLRLKLNQLVAPLTIGQYRVQQDQERARANQRAQADRNLRLVGPGEPPAEDELPTDGAALERLFAAYKEVAAATAALPGRPEKTATWTPGEEKPVGVAFLGDVHAGGIGVDYAAFERDVALIAETDGLYGILMGDLIDNFKPQAKSGSGLYHQAFADPGLQVAYVTTRLRWAKGKWVALAGGNHEGFDGRWAGIDRLPALAADLGCPYFTEAGGSIHATIGRQPWHLIVKHQTRGASQLNKGNAARRLWDEWPWAWANGDVVALAHLHEPHLEQPIRKGEKVVYLRVGTYKEGDEWAESRGYRPGYGVGLVILWPDRRTIIAHHPHDFLEGVEHLRQVRAAWPG